MTRTATVARGGRPVHRLGQRQPAGRQPARPRLQDERNGHAHLRDPGRAGRTGPAAGDARPAERRSDARTVQGRPAVRRSQARQRGRNRRRNLDRLGRLRQGPSSQRRADELRPPPPPPSSGRRHRAGQHDAHQDSDRTRTRHADDDKRTRRPRPPRARRHARTPSRAANTRQQQANANIKKQPLSQRTDRQRGDARSQPRVGQGGRQERQADGAERRTGRAEHQALRARGRHDRLAVRSGRRSRVRKRNDQGLERQQLLQRIGIERGRRAERPPRAGGLARPPARRARPAQPAPRFGLVQLLVRGPQRPQLDAARRAAERIGNRQRQGSARSRR